MFRLPTRTRVLMLFALIAAAWFSFRMNRPARPAAASTPLEVLVVADGGVP